MPIRRAAASILAVAAVAGIGAVPARGQEKPRRPGVERSVVVTLAYTLGEAHALHRLCAGPADATWYDRMRRLIAQEAQDPSARRQLVASFNAGFAARSAQYPTCNRRSRQAEAAVAEHGRELAQRLAAPGETP